MRADPTREPRPPPFPIGTRLRCVEGIDAYVPHVARPRDLRDHPEDWARISGRGLEVTIARVEPGIRGTGRQLHDEDGPMVDASGKPILDATQDGYSVYQVMRKSGKMSGRCIVPCSASKWQLLSEPLTLPQDEPRADKTKTKKRPSGVTVTRTRHGGFHIKAFGPERP